MFEDSLVESTGRIRTRTRWLAIASFALQAVILAVLVLLPLVHPYALPRQGLSRLFVAPPPPSSPAPRTAASTPQQAHTVTITPLDNSIHAPRSIPNRVAMVADNLPSGPNIPGSIDGSGPGNGISNLFSDGRSPAPTVMLVKPASHPPVHISSTVIAGQLLSPIQPVYPVIARTANIQGTVVVDAVISKEGRIEQLHVRSGPQMLQQAALSAIAVARYRPFLLNGDPVEVETTINVIFTLNR